MDYQRNNRITPTKLPMTDKTTRTETPPAPRDRAFWTTARIGKANDARIKLTDEQREAIKQLHKDGVAIREIARQYESFCSRTTIQHVLFPERQARRARRSKDNQTWKNYTDKETMNKRQTKHRAKIKKLHEQGIIK